MGGNIGISEFLRPICRELGMEFVTMSEWKEHDILWRYDTWLKEIEKSDIVVCVARHEIQDAKSSNRVMQGMAFSKPVIASPLPAYQEVICHGQNGMICDAPADWRNALKQLRDDPLLRERMGNAAKETAREFSIEKIGEAWIGLLRKRALRNCSPPKVDIIIPTLCNIDYLKVCVESIRRNTDWPHNIIVVASGGNKDGTLDWVCAQPDIIHVISPERLHFSAANNAGLGTAKEEYVCLLNDDTIVGHGWLNALMHEAQKPGVGAVGPFSNCDRGWLHDEVISVGGRNLIPGMSLHDLQEAIPSIYSYRHPKEVLSRKWVAFYCTVMPREAVDKVGLLDEGFLSGDEDVDYCKRLRDAGYWICQTYDAWVFHFGGKTRKQSDEADPQKHQREDQENHAYFRKKWGFAPGAPELRNELVAPPILASVPRAPSADRRPLFGIYTGEAYERWCPKSVDEGGIGGSETATVFTAREFHRKGFRSIVFGDCAGLEGDYGGVEYIDHNRLQEFARRNDFAFFVSSRRPDVWMNPIRAEKKATLAHDIWFSPDPNAEVFSAQVDKVFVLSPWHKEFILKHHQKLDPAKVAITRDGVDLDRFTHNVKRDRGRMVWSSSPDRGLDILLDCLPAIRKAVPEANVQVFYGFDNWEKAASRRGDPKEIRWIEDLKKRLDEPGVVYRGRIGQMQLAKEMQKAELWAYPTTFTETFAITSVENMASGNPVITNPLAALETTVGDAGVLLPGDVRSKEYKGRFTEECILMLTDKARWEAYSAKSLERAKRYSWHGIADEWLGLVGMQAPKPQLSPCSLKPLGTEL